MGVNIHISRGETINSRHYKKSMKQVKREIVKIIGRQVKNWRMFCFMIQPYVSGHPLPPPFSDKQWQRYEIRYEIMVGYKILFYLTDMGWFFGYGTKSRYDISKLSELRYVFSTVLYCRPWCLMALMHARTTCTTYVATQYTGKSPRWCFDNTAVKNHDQVIEWLIFYFVYMKHAYTLPGSLWFLFR